MTFKLIVKRCFNKYSAWPWDCGTEALLAGLAWVG